MVQEMDVSSQILHKAYSDTDRLLNVGNGMPGRGTLIMIYIRY